MPLTIPNSADATYPAQAELDSGDVSIIVAAHGRTGVVSGGAVTAQGTPDMTVAVAAGTDEIAGVPVAVAGGNVTITGNSSGNPRIDLITVDTSGTKAAVAGTAAASPVYPAIPASRVVHAAVYVPTGVTAITNAMISDRRVVLVDILEPPIVFSYTGVVAVATGAHRFYVEEAAVLLDIRASVGTVPTGASLIVDVNKNGTTVFTTQANRPTIAVSTNTDGGNVPDVTSLAAGDYLTVDVDQVGSTEPGRDLTVSIRLRKG